MQQKQRTQRILREGARGVGWFVVLAAMLLVAPVASGCMDDDETGLADRTTTINMVAQDQEINDQAIRATVAYELERARGVDTDGMVIRSDDGIVTLTGTVDHLLAHDRAEKIATTIKGVRAVVNELIVEPAMKSDAELLADIEQAYRIDPATEEREITTTVVNGAVTLSGTVDSWREKQLAGRVAKGVEGVVELNNDLAVDYTGERPDAEIREEVVQALMWDARIDDGLLRVNVEDGVVWLSGSVGSAYERALAKTHALTDGVTEVDASGLEVKWWARDYTKRAEWPADKSDTEVEDAIVDALVKDPRVASYEIEVSVENGVATLSGVVDNVKAMRVAAEDAANTVGVVDVDNKIAVALADMVSDATAMANVESALRVDPYVDEEDVTAVVVDGVATISGTVDSYFEKWQAEDVVSRVLGVTAVVNDLDVAYDPLYSTMPYFDWDPVLGDRDVEPITMTDAELLERVENELWWSPFVNEDSVNVAVDDATVTLTGTVSSWTAYREATTQALEAGALAVENFLEVEQREVGS